MAAVTIKDKRGLSYEVSGESLKVGRAIDNDIVIKDKNVSRYHIALQPLDDGLIIFNTGSESGFYINEQQFLDSGVARNGDVIRIGQEEFFVAVQGTLKSSDFAFTGLAENSRTGSLDVNSKNKKIRSVLLGMVALMMIGLVLMPVEEQNPNRSPASDNDKPTEGLPNDAFIDLDFPRMGPQEVTADDLYKQGARQMRLNNHIRAIQYFQQSLVEDPSLGKSRTALMDAESSLKNRIENIVMKSEKHYADSRLSLSRSLANQALDLMSELIPGFSYKIHGMQRSAASRRDVIPSREQIYLEMPCSQTPDEKVCERAVDILKRSRIKLGEENVLK